MLFELAAQIRCLQLFGGSKGCISSRVEVQRNILPRKPHGLEVFLGQLVVEILLQGEDCVSKVSRLSVLVESADSYPGEDSGRFSSIESRIIGLAGLACEFEAGGADPIVFRRATLLVKG
jgi:hypothetical protein